MASEVVTALCGRTNDVVRNERFDELRDSEGAFRSGTVHYTGVVPVCTARFNP